MAAVLECTLCDQLFSEFDILHYRFFIETRICYKCYRKLQKAPFSISCFGKRSTKANLGFDVMAEECRTWCPDRSLCPKFANGTLVQLHKQTASKTEAIIAVHEQKFHRAPSARKYPWPQNSLVGRCFIFCMKKVSLEDLKKWCARNKTNHYRMLRAFRHGARHGKTWGWKEQGGKVWVEYHI